MKHLNWEDIRLFRAVAAHKSLRAAACSLNISPPTLGRRVQRLEESLGAPLFNKGQSGYEVTSFGLEVLDRTRSMSDAVTGLGNWSDRVLALPLITISAPEEIIWMLTGNIRELWQPTDEFRLSFCGPQNLRQLEHDRSLVQIAGKRPKTGNIKAKTLTTLRYGVYCCATFDQQNDCNWVAMRSDHCTNMTYEPKPQSTDPWVTIWADSFSSLVALTLSGAGRAVLPTHVASRVNGLIEVETFFKPTAPLFILSHFEGSTLPHVNEVKKRIGAMLSPA